MGAVAQSLTKKLTDALSPVTLDIVDQSALHAGHAGATPGGETHFDIAITAAAFQGLSRVARQRLVYGVVAEELDGPVHALSLTTKAPGEG
jgi:BolA protein